MRWGSRRRASSVVRRLRRSPRWHRRAARSARRSVAARPQRDIAAARGSTTAVSLAGAIHAAIAASYSCVCRNAFDASVRRIDSGVGAAARAQRVEHRRRSRWGRPRSRRSGSSSPRRASSPARRCRSPRPSRPRWRRRRPGAASRGTGRGSPPPRRSAPCPARRARGGATPWCGRRGSRRGCADAAS